MLFGSVKQTLVVWTTVPLSIIGVTIMFGLGFATLLTLIVVPVLFGLFYKTRYRPDSGAIHLPRHPRQDSI